MSNKNIFLTQKDTPSIIANTLKIEGNLFCEGFTEIEGFIEGNISGKVVTIREKGSVNGDVTCDQLNIKGKFDGNIKANKISISGEAIVSGTIEYSFLFIDNGASVEGNFKRVKVSEKEQSKDKNSTEK